ncbi:MAG: hypothetical protein JWR85_240 [Marmoricola sp.]|nr:hypothetical protein [Marmoricola sp.]
MVVTPSAPGSQARTPRTPGLTYESNPSPSRPIARSQRFSLPSFASALASDLRVASIPTQRNGSGWERDRLLAHHLQPGAWGVLAREQVQEHVTCEAGRSDAEAGEAKGVGDPASQRSAVEGGEAGAGVDDAAPDVAEADVGELRKGGEEVLGEHLEGLGALVVLLLDPAGEVVDRVVPAPQDSPVPGGPEVVKLVAEVGDALAAAPADGVALRGSEWLGHQRVVVDRHRHQPESPQQRRKRVGREYDVPGLHLTGVGLHRDPGGGAGNPGHGCLLRDPDTQRLACGAESPDQPRGLEDRRPRIVYAGQERRRVHPVAKGVGVEPRAAHAACAHRVVLLAQSGHLIGLGRHGQRSGPDEVAVDRVLLDGALDAVEVLATHARQHVELVGPARQAVAETVGQARLAEASVATAGRVAARRALDEEHVARRIPLLGQQRGPQAEVATTDDDEVGRVRSGQSGQDRWVSRVVEPVRDRAG